MANLSLTLFISIFGSIFINEKVEALDTVVSLLNTFQQLYAPIINTAQLPVTYPLPPLGTTACSTYPHADKGVLNFQEKCYTQLYLQPSAYYPYKCRTTQFTVGVPLVEVPFTIPQVVGFTPQAGYYYTDSVSITNTSQHLTYNFTFVEAQMAELTDAFTDVANLTVITTSVITSYTDKGFVFVICPVDQLRTPLCASPTYVFLCTYQRNPPQDDVDALALPLNQYPYYFGKNLQVMDQTDC